jgi:hypothetical protein
LQLLTPPATRIEVSHQRVLIMSWQNVPWEVGGGFGISTGLTMVFDLLGPEVFAWVLNNPTAGCECLMRGIWGCTAAAAMHRLQHSKPSTWYQRVPFCGAGRGSHGLSCRVRI